MHAKNWRSALLSGKCPRCHKGDIFKYSAFDVTRFFRMNETCPHCHVSFVPEPGFYFGAMYVSYAISVALFVIIGVVLYYFYDPSEWIYLLSITLAAILITPLSFRYSRILFLYAFGGIRFDPQQ